MKRRSTIVVANSFVCCTHTQVSRHHQYCRAGYLRGHFGHCGQKCPIPLPPSRSPVTTSSARCCSKSSSRSGRSARTSAPTTASRCDHTVETDAQPNGSPRSLEPVSTARCRVLPTHGVPGWAGPFNGSGCACAHVRSPGGGGQPDQEAGGGIAPPNTRSTGARSRSPGPGVKHVQERVVREHLGVGAQDANGWGTTPPLSALGTAGAPLARAGWRPASCLGDPAAAAGNERASLLVVPRPKTRSWAQGVPRGQSLVGPVRHHCAHQVAASVHRCAEHQDSPGARNDVPPANPELVVADTVLQCRPDELASARCPQSSAAIF